MLFLDGYLKSILDAALQTMIYMLCKMVSLITCIYKSYLIGQNNASIIYHSYIALLKQLKLVQDVRSVLYFT